MKICFVAPHAYPLFVNSLDDTVGGSEFQQVSIAKELVKKGYQVSFVVGDFGQSELEYIDGIELIKSYRLFHGSAKFRYLANMLSLMKAMSKANADVYFQRAGMFYTSHVALFCTLKKRKFIYSAGHDRNCNPELQSRMSSLIKRFYRYGLRRADVVIAQSEYQKNLFKENYGVDSVVIKNGYRIPEISSNRKADNIVLWVGKALDWKGPELFLELARRVQEFAFEMVCAPARQYTYYSKLKKEAEKIPNLKFYGFVPIERIESFFERASVFVNTSSSEGFPNTFLQAWSRCAPTVSLNVDPDCCICSNEIGLHSKDFGQLVEDVKNLSRDTFLRERMGKAGRQYVEKEHDIRKVSKKYADILEKI
jgi:glycosyltransferase involved in cell wall biosynthesis